jgi:tellurite methyltransferase
MRRAITGYATDELGDPVAELVCGHRQHVRHQPPFFLRPWVLTEEGRASMLGTELDCVRCDRAEIPEGFVAYRRTPEFDETSIPAGLRKSHATKPGVWGVIHVCSGQLLYRTPGEPAVEQRLDPQTRGIIVPEVLHSVEPLGAVRFYLELHRAPDLARSGRS